MVAFSWYCNWFRKELFEAINTATPVRMAATVIFSKILLV